MLRTQRAVAEILESTATDIYTTTIIEQTGWYIKQDFGHLACGDVNNSWPQSQNAPAGECEQIFF